MPLVESVKCLGDYKLEIAFTNKKIKAVDLEKFLMEAKNPMTTQFRDKKRFRNVWVYYGNLAWEDNQMDLTAEWLYKIGK